MTQGYRAQTKSLDRAAEDWGGEKKETAPAALRWMTENTAESYPA